MFGSLPVPELSGRDLVEHAASEGGLGRCGAILFVHNRCVQLKIMDNDFSDNASLSAMPKSLFYHQTAAGFRSDRLGGSGPVDGTVVVLRQWPEFVAFR